MDHTTELMSGVKLIGTLVGLGLPLAICLSHIVILKMVLWNFFADNFIVTSQLG